MSRRSFYFSGDAAVAGTVVVEEESEGRRAESKGTEKNPDEDAAVKRRRCWRR